MIRLEEYQETLLGEIKYIDPDASNLDVTFRSHSDLFEGHPEDMKAIQVFMSLLMVDSSR